MMLLFGVALLLHYFVLYVEGCGWRPDGAETQRHIRPIYIRHTTNDDILGGCRNWLKGSKAYFFMLLLYMPLSLLLVAEIGSNAFMFSSLQNRYFLIFNIID